MAEQYKPGDIVAVRGRLNGIAPDLDGDDYWIDFAMADGSDIPFAVVDLAPWRTAEQIAAYDVLVAQVRAVVLITKAGGDLRIANLDDRLMVDRLQDTLDAINRGGKP